MIPSGSKDPLGLRRAAQGIVKILVEGRIRLNLDKFITEGAEETNRVFLRERKAGYAENRGPDGTLELAKQLRDFMTERVKYYFREVRGFAYDEISAVLAAQPPDLVDVEARLHALKMVRQTEDFEPLAASFKRIGNILKQAGQSGGEVTESLLESGAEKDLFQDMTRVLARVHQLRQSDDYIQALLAVATLRPAVDNFFDQVLVNASDAAVRQNRLALLGRLFSEVSSIADFSEIVTSSTSE
jgi:glycyl-tRNA synthetase beta chain